jgi:hypothetical protein
VVPLARSQPRMTSRFCCHQRAQGLAPRTTVAVAWLAMLCRPQRSNRVGSLRPKKGS